MQQVSLVVFESGPTSGDHEHADRDAEAFTTLELAVAYARAYAHAHEDGYGVRESDVPGQRYHAHYNGWGDAVWVVERSLDPPPP